MTPSDPEQLRETLALAAWELAEARNYDRAAYALRRDAVHSLLASAARPERDAAIKCLADALSHDRAANKLRTQAARRLATLHAELAPAPRPIHRLPAIPLQRAS